ncbi:MAG: leucine-rich repeat domain-containing protein, partial [Cyanobacteria bacterium J06628_3]
NLTHLDISNNQIKDVKPLSDLKNLTDFGISSDKNCPLQQKSVCRFQ